MADRVAHGGAARRAVKLLVGCGMTWACPPHGRDPPDPPPTAIMIEPRVPIRLYAAA
jgi:hypothetical protein